MEALSEIDQQMCTQYVPHGLNLERWNVRRIYWSLFCSNLILLFLGSWIFIRAQRAIDGLKNDSYRRRKLLRTYSFICLGCLAASVTVVVMEAYSLLALQFCDNEILMSLYWSTWTSIQIGSLVAIAGIIMALFHSLTEFKHPPWALALGTPILVIAGIMCLFHDLTKSTVKKLRRRARSASDESQGPRISQANTIENSRDEDKCYDVQAEFIGFTVEGGPIVRLTQPVTHLPSGEFLGRDSSGQSIYSFPRGVVRFDAE
ncbi:hypothetical protein ED733_000288 [Metarhizium rileyi]|uniref:Uncharacterized protein n=1 Tax=Metarhizium rileyi (strain RCEF 4871) TaxID=1649241 RepID=A0A5C6G2J0_METRR|nr:hypothetical protein ED733_000288 [Metarhizium rileyi]